MFEYRPTSLLGSRTRDLWHELSGRVVAGVLHADREQRLRALMNRIVERERIPLHPAQDLKCLYFTRFRARDGDRPGDGDDGGPVAECLSGNTITEADNWEER